MDLNGVKIGTKVVAVSGDYRGLRGTVMTLPVNRAKATSLLVMEGGEGSGARRGLSLPLAVLEIEHDGEEV